MGIELFTHTTGESIADAGRAADGALLRADDLVCGYGSVPILGPLSLELPRQAFLLIEGPNGVGKSTLLKTLIGLRPPLGGRHGWSVARHELRYVPQTRTLDPMLPATVYDVLATGLHQGSGWRALRLRRNQRELDAALEKVEMVGYRHHLFRELSEGQKQLILLARALIGAPSVLLLDEPAASMDPERELQSIALLRQVQAQGMTVIMIAHGSQPAREAATHIMSVHRDKTIDLEEKAAARRSSPQG